jgi:ankyrin repeat protein
MALILLVLQQIKDFDHMKALLLLLSLLFFTACTPTIKHVKRDLERNNFQRAMYDLKKMKRITPDKFSVIYENVVKKLTVDQTKQMLDLAISRGANINASDTNSLTLMDYAKDKNDIVLLTYLIEKGGIPQDADALFDIAITQEGNAFCDFLFSQGYSYSKVNQKLHQALLSKNYTQAKYWLKHGASINHDPLLMRIAVGNEDLNLANFLLNQGFLINRDSKLLTHVIKEEKVMFLALLIAEKFDINADPELLTYVLSIPDYPLADYLIENGAKLTDTTLFPQAIANRDFEMVQFLIKHGMKAHFPPTALATAFKNKDLKFAKLLLDLGVSFKGDLTPLTYCAKLHYKEGMELLLLKGAKINEKDSFGRTALMYVADDLILTDWLVHQGADVTVKDSEGRTTLMYAVAFNDVVDNLIIHGANVYEKDDQRRSLLNYAISINNMELVKELVEYKKLPINDVDKDGGRPLNYALDLEMSRYLMSHNAQH